MPSSITTSLLVKGCISDPLYHRACKMTIILADASILAKESPEAMLETEFQEYLTAKKGQIAGDIFEVYLLQNNIYIHRFLNATVTLNRFPRGVLVDS